MWSDGAISREGVGDVGPGAGDGKLLLVCGLGGLAGIEFQMKIALRWNVYSTILHLTHSMDLSADARSISRPKNAKA